MFLTGLTLGASGADRYAEAPSIVILEIQFSSPGIMTWWKDFLDAGPPVILGTDWIEDKSYLSLLPNRADLESARMNLGAEYVESLALRGVDTLSLGLGR